MKKSLDVASSCSSGMHYSNMKVNEPASEKKNHHIQLRRPLIKLLHLYDFDTSTSKSDNYLTTKAYLGTHNFLSLKTIPGY